MWCTSYALQGLEPQPGDEPCLIDLRPAPSLTPFSCRGLPSESLDLALEEEMKSKRIR